MKNFNLNFKIKPSHTWQIETWPDGSIHWILMPR